VQLTPEGEKLAKDVDKKHKILVTFLTKILGISHKIATEDACKMEHSIGSQTFEKLTKFMEFIEMSPVDGRPQWLQGFDHYLKTGKIKKCPMKRFRKGRI
jgi:DtxR family Mn-dependent transcriptional regulator